MPQNVRAWRVESRPCVGRAATAACCRECDVGQSAWGRAANRPAPRASWQPWSESMVGPDVAPSPVSGRSDSDSAFSLGRKVPRRPASVRGIRRSRSVTQRTRAAPRLAPLRPRRRGQRSARRGAAAAYFFGGLFPRPGPDGWFGVLLGQFGFGGVAGGVDGLGFGAPPLGLPPGWLLGFVVICGSAWLPVG